MPPRKEEWIASSLTLLAKTSKHAFTFSQHFQPVIASASEAIHAAAQGRMDCFVASLLAMTAEYTFAIPRRGAPEVCHKIPCPPVRGRRECRAPDAPDCRACNG